MAVEAFAGDTADPATLRGPAREAAGRFGLADLVLVGDRGMLTSGPHRAPPRARGIGWVSALRAPAIRALVEEGYLQLALFDERDLAEISSPDYPGERLVVCRNPVLAAERARKRDALLAATEAALERIVARVEPGAACSDEAAIGLRGRTGHRRAQDGQALRARHRGWSLRLHPPPEAIAAEAALDGLYVMRTSVPAERLDAGAVVRAYKRLAARGARLPRPQDVTSSRSGPSTTAREDRVRAHLFLCLLAAYVRWHLERGLGPAALP